MFITNGWLTIFQPAAPSNTGITVCGAEMLAQYLKPVIFPPRDMCQRQRHCWLSQLGGVLLTPMGGVQGAATHCEVHRTAHAQDYPLTC